MFAKSHHREVTGYSQNCSDCDMGEPRQEPLAQAPLEKEENTEQTVTNSENAKQEPGKNAESQSQASFQKIVSRRVDENGNVSYLVKLANKSYRHAKWVDGHEIEAMKKRFRRELPTAMNPNYTKVDKVIGERDTDNGKEYLVKWMDLDYEEATWEPEQDLEKEDMEAVDAFHQRIEKRKNLHGQSEMESWRCLTKEEISLDLTDWDLNGVNSLMNAWFRKRNMILCEPERQTMEFEVFVFLDQLVKRANVAGPFLFIAQNPKMATLAKNVAKWTNLSVVDWWGVTQRRELVKEYELFLPGTEIPMFDLLLLTSDVLCREKDLLSKIKWRCVTVDGHCPSAEHSSRTVDIVSLLESDLMVFLDESPRNVTAGVCGKIGKLIAPKEVQGITQFQEKYGKLAKSDMPVCLLSFLEGYTYERNSTESATFEETILNCPMTDEQWRLYREIYAYNARQLLSNERIVCERVFKQLRDMYNHPCWIRGDKDIFASGKMVMLRKLLRKLKVENKRVVVMSQTSEMLGLICKMMEIEEYRYRKIDGTVRGDNRENAIQEFKNDTECFALLIVTFAIDAPMDLPTVDTFVVYDSCLNPEEEHKAARIVTGDEVENIKLYRLFTANTFERQAYEIALPQRGKINSAAVIQLVKLGACHAFLEDLYRLEDLSEDIESVLCHSSSRKVWAASRQSPTTPTASQPLKQEQKRPEVVNKPVRKPEHKEETNGNARRAVMVKAPPVSDDEHDKDFSWNKERIVLLANTLLRFGWGRWETIHQKSKLHCSTAELKLACQAILRLLLSECTDNYPVMNYIRAQFRDKSGQPEAVFAQRNVQVLEAHVKPGANWKVGRLDLLYHVNLMVSACKNPPEDLQVPHLSTKLTDWWSEEDDKRLLFGVWEYGYLNYDRIRFTQESGEFTQTALSARVKALVNEFKEHYVFEPEPIPSQDYTEEEADLWTKEEHDKVIFSILNFGAGPLETLYEIANLPNKTFAEFQTYHEMLMSVVNKVAKGRIPPEHTLVRNINPWLARHIVSRIALFDNVRKYHDSFSMLKPEDAYLLNFIATHGLIGVADDENLVSRFGNDINETTVIQQTASLIDDLQLVLTTEIPKLPWHVSNRLTVINFGVIDHRREFFNERYFYPIGYEVRRLFYSVVEGHEKIWYRGRICESDSKPLFIVDVPSHPEFCYQGLAPSTPWRAVAQDVARRCGGSRTASARCKGVSGPDLFGLSCSAVMQCVQTLSRIQRICPVMEPPAPAPVTTTAAPPPKQSAPRRQPKESDAVSKRLERIRVKAISSRPRVLRFHFDELPPQPPSPDTTFTVNGSTLVSLCREKYCIPSRHPQPLVYLRDVAHH